MLELSCDANLFLCGSICSPDWNAKDRKDWNAKDWNAPDWNAKDAKDPMRCSLVYTASDYCSCGYGFDPGLAHLYADIPECAELILQ